MSALLLIDGLLLLDDGGGDVGLAHPFGRNGRHLHAQFLQQFGRLARRGGRIQLDEDPEAPALRGLFQGVMDVMPDQGTVRSLPEEDGLSQLDVLAEFGHFFLEGALHGLPGVERLGQERGRVPGVLLDRELREPQGEGLEILGAGDEIRFAVELDQASFFRVRVQPGADQALAGDASGFLGRGGLALLS
ncbi:MAG: hypothetical protein A2636_02310 [Elusimicrobia bacterium RIFCSPHIGHO2_01_FULL_64_10]|nr:MAG: hypothetical protein A2636_02310 [Elusimicrobia bacterium RIFCSPHIGHO2_01_FULL_64_10]